VIDDAFHQQYAAATDGVTGGGFLLRDWTTLVVRGADRATFLHNMCTNDIRGLATGDQCEAFLTDVKGKIVGHVVVLVLEKELLLLTVPHQAERLTAHLERYIIREDVQLVPLKGHWAIEFWQGRPSLASMKAGQDKSGLYGAPCRQLWTGGLWLGSPGSGWEPPASYACWSDAVWHAVRIESGWPLFGVDFDDSNLPQEVGRDEQAISFRKGCYLGQETVARIDALGHVNQRLCTVKLSAEASPGDELFAGDKVAGRLTSVCYSPRLQSWLAFAMIRRGHNDAGSQLVCRNEAAEVVPMPAVAA
jgi:folate-binding protein YgfZ